MKDAIFRLAGVILIAEEGPSFGTPVFAQDDLDSFFIQTSSDENYIEDFVKLPSRVNWKKRLAELRSNRSFVVGSPFLYGFRDREGRLTVDEKFVLQLKLQDEFAQYADLPFFSFLIAKFLQSEEFTTIATNRREIRHAIENGEIIAPLFSEQATVAPARAPETELIENNTLEMSIDHETAAKPKFVFTDEKVKLLKELWMAGLSASQIAAELGDVTRNAVIGKVHRLGLSSRTSKSADQSIHLKRLRKKIPITSKAPSDKHRLSLLELNERTCHWPVGDPSSPEFFFCGAKTLAGIPYCAHHARLALTPVSDRPHRPKA